MNLGSAIKIVDHTAHLDDRWMFVALLIVGIVTIYFLARYFIRQIAELQREIVAVRELQTPTWWPHSPRAPRSSRTSRFSGS